jgi:hypothetical protein
LMKGEQKVVGGSAANKAMAGVSRVLPDRMKATAQGKLHEPGSGNPD